jgi:hypothetical protein
VDAKRFVGVASVIAAAAIVIAGAGATARPAKVELSTKAGVAKYLRSIGMNPRGVVIQRGLRNYAGPNCPGRRWTCTRSTRVFQIAKAGGTNKSECTPSVAVPSEEEPGCVIEQHNTDGNNDARCIQETNELPAVQDCMILQTNVNGNNRATVVQKVDQNNDPNQSSSQSSRIDQQNLAGDNDAKVTQDAGQKTGEGASQQQSNNQLSCVKQHPPTTFVNACVDDALTGIPTGNDMSDVNQSIAQDAHGAELTLSQTQNSFVTGHVFQDTSGKATNHNDQHEHQTEVGAALQTQFGPLSCCTDQGTNPADKFHINQHAVQQASSDTADQFEEIIGQCTTTGECHAEQNAVQDGTSQHNDCRGTDCSIGIVCASVSDESEVVGCTPCTPIVSEGVFCQPPCSEICLEAVRTTRAHATPRVNIARLLRSTRAFR